MHDLNLIMKKHRQTQIQEHFRKYQACSHQKCQGHKNFKKTEDMFKIKGNSRDVATK